MVDLACHILTGLVVSSGFERFIGLMAGIRIHLPKLRLFPVQMHGKLSLKHICVPQEDYDITAEHYIT